MLVMTGERDDEATMALLDWLLEEQLPGDAAEDSGWNAVHRDPATRKRF